MTLQLQITDWPAHKMWHVQMFAVAKTKDFETETCQTALHKTLLFTSLGKTR